MRLGTTCGAALVGALMAAGAVGAAPKYDPGASDSEILIGITAPLSGPASAYGVACQAHDAYFRMINEEKGGVNGRKLKLLCEDDGFSPPRAIEQTRKLVESSGVLFMYNSLGTSTNSAVQPYLTSMEVPQLLLNSGASKWLDPAANPWQTSSIPQNRTEAEIFARHILATKPGAKVAVLQQSDDYGKDYVAGLKLGFGDAYGKIVVAHETFELSDPTVDSQMLKIASSGADVVVLGALAKHAAQAIRKMGEIQGFKPQIYLGWASSGIDSVLVPAGVAASTGIISTAVIKHPDDPAWANDAGVKTYRAFMDKYFPAGVKSSISNVYAYATDEVLVDILTRAGDDLTRANINKMARQTDVQPSMYIDGVRFTISTEDLDPIKAFQLIQFDGAKWNQIGEPFRKK